MRHSASKGRLLILMGLFAAASSWLQPRVQARETKTVAAKVNKAAPPLQLVFGSLGIASKSAGARQQLEITLDRYENAQYADAVLHAKRAIAQGVELAAGL